VDDDVKRPAKDKCLTKFGGLSERLGMENFTDDIALVVLGYSSIQDIELWVGDEGVNKVLGELKTAHKQLFWLVASGNIPALDRWKRTLSNDDAKQELSLR